MQYNLTYGVPAQTRFIVDDLVMVNVRQIAEMGAYVQLLEYDNIEGMILLSELSRRRIRSIQKLIRVGKNEVVVVLRVDKEKGEHIQHPITPYRSPPPLSSRKTSCVFPSLGLVRGTRARNSLAKNDEVNEDTL